MKRSSAIFKSLVVLGILTFGLVAGASAHGFGASRSRCERPPITPSMPPIPPINDCTPAPAGLVSWWPAERNANDIVDGNDGTIQNITYTHGEVGQAFVFNGSDSGIVIPASTSLDVGSSGGFTLEAWINPTDVSQRCPLFEWNVGDGVTYWGVHFYIDPVSFDAGPGALYANIVDNNGSWHLLHTPAGVVTTKVFQHVALTYDQASGMATIYCNGVVVAQQNLGSFTPLTTYDLYLGRRPLTQGETYAFAGLLDEPAVYRGALSSNEIAAIYAAGHAGKCVPARRVGLWPADGNANDTAGGNDGTLQGGASFGKGKIGKAFSFNGLSSSVQIPKATDLDVGNQVTIEFWMKAAKTNAMDTYQGLVASDFYGVEISNGFQSHMGVNFFVSSASGSSWGMISEANGGGAIVSAGEWHHVAGTYDGSQAQLYIDGQPWGNPASYSGAISPMSENGFLTFGSEDGRAAFPDCVGTRYFNGLIDEVSVFNRALTATEIKTIYQLETRINACHHPVRRGHWDR